MTVKRDEERRSCPGEKYSITAAICRTRQRNQYPKCLLCPHRDAEVAGSVPTDPKVSASIFRRSAVLGRVPQEVNDYVMRKVGLASAQLLRAENPSGRRLAVACDVRENGRSFTRAFSEGVNRGGTDVVNLGTVPPDVLGFVLGTDGFTGGAFIGGGNSSEKVNGVRLWGPDGSIIGFGSGLDKVGLIARRMRLGCSRLPGEVSTAEPLPEYLAYLLKFAPNLKPLNLVVDAGNGTAARVLEGLFEELAVEPIRRRFEEDGHAELLGKRFPSEQLIASMRSDLRNSSADGGAAFDFDGERVAFFDERGNLLRHDTAAALIATELLRRNPGQCVTFDVRSSAALSGRVRNSGGEPVSAPTTRQAFARHFRRNDALYGADATGLHYFRDFFRFHSPFLALLILCSHLSREEGRLSEMAGELERFNRSGEVSIPLPAGEVADKVLTRVRDEFTNAERDLIDGLTVRTRDWWFNLRQPGKRSELRLNVEGRHARDVRRGRQTVEKLVKSALAGQAR